MATINTIEDLIRVLDENPQWAEALRSRILTRELLELPARFAEYAKATDERFEAIDRRFEAIDRRFEAIDRQFEIVNARIESVDRYLESMDRHLERLDMRMGRFEGDMSLFRSRHAAEMVRGQSNLLAREMGYQRIRTLTADDLFDMVDNSDTGGIPMNVLRSFRRADLIMEAIKNDTGEPCYIAVEVSFTVNGRDTERAVRNKELLTRFTGREAVPVVAGLRKDRRVDDDIEDGIVVWYELEDKDLTTT